MSRVQHPAGPCQGSNFKQAHVKGQTSNEARWLHVKGQQCNDVGRGLRQCSSIQVDGHSQTECWHARGAALGELALTCGQLGTGDAHLDLSRISWGMSAAYSSSVLLPSLGSPRRGTARTSRAATAVSLGERSRSMRARNKVKDGRFLPPWSRAREHGPPSPGGLMCPSAFVRVRVGAYSWH